MANLLLYAVKGNPSKEVMVGLAEDSAAWKICRGENVSPTFN